MLVEKKTLLGPLLLWLTGCSAVSPGHLPFCARASISVPGAPASSLLTGSQVLVLKPGVEICAPVWVATALLCTSQPADPRFATSLAPVPAGAASPAPARGVGVAAQADEVAAAVRPGALVISPARVSTDIAVATRRAE